MPAHILPDQAEFEQLCHGFQAQRSWETTLNAVFAIAMDSYRGLQARCSLEELSAIEGEMERLLAACLEGRRVAARCGGGLFLMAVHELDSLEDLEALGRELIEALTLRASDGREITVSIGAALCRHDPDLGYRCAFAPAMQALEELRSPRSFRLSSQRPWRVLVVEDQELARSQFERILRESGRYQLSWSIRSADLADVYCENGTVDLILMDVYTELGADGLAAAKRIKRRFPEIKIIIVTSMPEVSWLDRAREAGVESFWYKELHQQPLLSLMDRTMAGESVYPDRTPQVRLGLVSSDQLSRRELEILRELISGDTNEEIAKRMFISIATVKTHIGNLLQKTGFKSRTELAIRARETGLVIR